MNTRDQNNALSEALLRFETCLETPVVPGELPQWSDAARAACDEVAVCLRREIDRSHPEFFRQIKEQDAGLDTRIDEMHEADKQLLAEMEGVDKLLHRLAQAAAAVEPDESRLNGHVKQAVDAGLQLVLAVRKQEQAITTWFMESLDRDRGVVD